MNILNFSTNFLNLLTQCAEQSSRQRQHKNIHKNYNEPCQRLFNAIGLNSYIRPHRHLLSCQDECLIAVRGRMALLVFDDVGKVVQTIRFGTQFNIKHQSFGVGVNVPADVWHTVIAESPGSILFEAKSGPFIPEQAKEYAVWAPEENTSEAAEYFLELKQLI